MPQRINSSATTELYENLRSRFGPSAFKPQDVNAMITSADRDIEDYEAEVVRLRARMAYIQMQQQRLEDYKVKSSALLSPIRAIPNEILAGIFDYVCQENLLQDHPWPSATSDDEDDEDDEESDGEEDDASVNEDEDSEDEDEEDSSDVGDRNDAYSDDEEDLITQLSAPAVTYLPTLVISAVCYRWRELALSLPSLWSRLRVEISTSSKRSRSPVSLAATLEQFLQRSGDWPLAIVLHIKGRFMETPHTALVNLAAHTHRWQIFEYAGQHTLTHFDILEDSHFPILSKLYLNADSRAIPPSDLIRFQNAPKLKVLATDHLFPSKIPHDELVSAELGINSRGDMERVLQSCPSLNSLDITPLPRFRRPKSSVSPSTWANISSLDIREDTRGDFSQMVFSSFSFPSLYNLRIRLLNKNISRLELDSFISKSSCQITCFTIDYCSLSDTNLIAALRLMPQLREFQINDHDEKVKQTPITSRLFSSLQAGSITALVPKLQSLRLTGLSSEQPFDHRAFLNMILSRWTPDPKVVDRAEVDCLREVVVKCVEWGRDAEEVYKPLRDLNKLGLRVVVEGRR